MGYMVWAADETRTEQPELTPQFQSLYSAISAFRVTMLSGDPAIALRLEKFQQALFNDIRETFAALQDQDTSGGLKPEDLPPALRNRFIGVSGRAFRVLVFPKKDIWQRPNQEEFIQQLRSKIPADRVTGTPVQLLEYETLLKNSYEQAALYALGAIALMVFFHFRSLFCVILSLLPVAIGTTWLAGLMGGTGIPFNPADIMTLPLVIGIGVTNGIHILNRFAEEQQAGILARSTGKAVLVSGLTAMTGFGSLILGRHQGIQSLGLVMSIGIATCMVAGLTFLPALLNLLVGRGMGPANKKTQQRQCKVAAGSGGTEVKTRSRLAPQLMSMRLDLFLRKSIYILSTIAEMTTGAICVIIGRVRRERTAQQRSAVLPRRVAASVCGWLLFAAFVCVQARAGGGEAGSPAVPPLSLTNLPAERDIIAGPAWSDYRLTLESGRRQEAAGPLFAAEQTGLEWQWGLAPLFSYTRTPDVDWTESESLYPLFTWRRFGTEYRVQLMQLLSFSGGGTQDGPDCRLFTVFPLYFQRRSDDPKLNYTAVVPFYGHLENRLFHDDIKFVLFPLYSETRKNKVVTDNYLYPFFHLRSGGNVTGWQFWPVLGAEQKRPGQVTNSVGEVETDGGYDRFFAAWPFFYKDLSGLGTTNQEDRLEVAPFYSRLRSPLRDETCYGWPFGYWRTDDRGKKYRERDFLWPFVVIARGEKTETRVFPFFSRGAARGLEDDYYLWPLYKYLRTESPGFERERTRIAFFLYSDLREKNRENGEQLHRVDFWPFFTYSRDMEQKERLQALSLLEPFFPNNQSVARDYSPLWSLWRTEKDGRTGAASQSLLWNLYRRESAPGTKKVSLLFGLFQYQSGDKGAHWRVCYIPFGKKPGN